ncbi:MAG: type II toxin-antitoxin system VapB family antitoxin [Rhodospirillaceae bacterium]
MALNITNQRVEAKAVEVARLTGMNKTASVEAALDYYIQAHAERAERMKLQKRAKMHEVLKRLSERPVLDDRASDAILDDDATGRLR